MAKKLLWGIVSICILVQSGYGQVILSALLFLPVLPIYLTLILHAGATINRQGYGFGGFLSTIGHKINEIMSGVGKLYYDFCVEFARALGTPLVSDSDHFRERQEIVRREDAMKRFSKNFNSTKLAKEAANKYFKKLFNTTEEVDLFDLL